ncbi:hypothetical protein HOB10_00785 [Candidatus Parcubacteria bacterium]|jgi:hypothetical protein|nr:hypothetical protein [Candidatus Parcubacteria bacterium]
MEMPWIFAKTYAKIAPHEYIVKENELELFDEYKIKISKSGKEEEFTLHGKMDIYRYYYEGDYKYWIMGNILNRAKI